MGYLYLTFFISATSALVIFFKRWRTSSRPYPPGPRPDPFIGNLRQIPKRTAWLTYTAWNNAYGDIISAEALGKRIVVIKSAKIAYDLFERRGSIYSDRPHNVMIHDLIGFGWNIIFQPYSDKFRTQRKLMNVALNPTAIVDYVHKQERETYALLNRLLDTPEKFYQHIKRAAGAVIMAVAYGHTVQTDNDYYVQLADDVVFYLRPAIQPASFLVNLIPILKYLPAWFPLADFQHYARKGRALSDKLREEPFAMVKSQFEKGVAPHSFTSTLLEAKGSITDEVDEEQQIKATAAALYGAGSDTSVSALVTFILAMVLHPEIQKKAQSELDSVVGSTRLPTIADRNSLPYINCIMLEVLRWHPVSALGVPHAAKEDGVYESYFIPRGAVIIGNIWAMSRDEEVYEDPERFWPERFDGRFPDIKDPRTFVFGFGRRSCPGRHIAANTLFIGMTCLLSAFNFGKLRDADGNEIDPHIDYSAGPPAPFECRITPRSKETISLIRANQIGD